MLMMICKSPHYNPIAVAVSSPANTNPYRKSMAFVMKGVKNARRKFHSQLDPAASEAWYDRVRVGNVSPVRIHTPLYCT